MHGRGRYADLTGPVRLWYRRRGRALPWRGIADPYRILLSEIMLQQTQVARVLEMYPRFLRRFPTLTALSRAPVRDVIIAWRGMGYNARAVRLHALARRLTEEHHGRLPSTAEELLRLPGVGRYTAHALLSAVYGKPVPVVDVNIRRLLSRVFFRMGTYGQMKGEADIWAIAESLVPSRRSYEWHQALMDLGATVCIARQPACETCPLGRICVSRGLMRPARAQAPKAEPGLDGIPNRIYRGRIVEELRRAGGTTGIAEVALGKRIHAEFGAGHAAWLRSLLAALESDGLVRIARGRKTGQRRIALA